jgi:pantoate--beta-alanine ligase
MRIVAKTAELQAFSDDLKKHKKIIGFVPTMGALHEGHLSLISASRQSCDITICSIFVNPRQFNNPEDLRSYPRTPEDDARLLEKAGCDVLFRPNEEEVYGGAHMPEFDLGPLANILEGRFRPGHFDGVAKVVLRLFEIVNPDVAFFGSKDFQQVLVVKQIVQQLKVPVQIVSCPILREPDGLAMSSRNRLMNESERKVASEVPVMLEEALKIVRQKSIAEAREFVQVRTGTNPLMKLDYFEVCNPENLDILSNGNLPAKFVLLIAVHVGKVRLIDNLVS